MAQAAAFGRRGVVVPPPTRTPQPRPAPSQKAVAAPSDPKEKSALGVVLWLLFSFKGRLDRGTYRLCRFVANIAVLLSFYGLKDVLPKTVGNPGLLAVLALTMLGLYGVWIWSTLAMQVKRRHDRDKSWWWLFVGFVPIVGPFWVLVETCWLNGTPGYNRFDDPDKTAAAAFA